MSATTSTLATFARFVSIAVVSCMLMTVGMWCYKHRNDITGAARDFHAKGGFHPATWMLWVSGQELEDPKSPTLPEFKAQQGALEKITIDPDWLENYNKSFIWQPDDR
jgi:hypothetical protein